MTTAINTAGNALRQSAAEKIDNGAPVIVPELQVGYMWAQGDVGVLRIDSLPREAHKEPMPPTGQIAPGNTKGSRHCIAQEHQGHVEFYRVNDRDALSDVCLKALKPWRLEHPEHADCTFEAGTYRILHQQNEQMERVRD